MVYNVRFSVLQSAYNSWLLFPYDDQTAQLIHIIHGVPSVF